MTKEKIIKRLEKRGYVVIDCKNNEYNVKSFYKNGKAKFCEWGSITKIYKMVLDFERKTLY